jgi:RNA binding exosome subunit
MGIHHIYLRATASGIDNISSITDAMTWLCGNEDLIHIDRTTSYHGSEINLITVKLSKNKDIKSIIERLTKEDLSAITSNLEQRIDQDNTLHFRICLNSLIGQKIIVVNAEERAVKCNIKIESYPGQNSLDNIIKILGLKVSI